MSIHANFLDEIRSRLTLSEVIGQRIPVSRAGREFKACCPFHKEKTPSFTINDDKGFYHCFGCGAHGDVLGFVMQHDNLPFPEAVELLAAQAGLQVPQFSREENAKAKEEKDLYTLMDDAAKWFSAQLFDPRHSAILGYITDRGFSQDTVHAFRLGFAPPDHQALRTYLAEKGYKDSQMIAVGLVKKGREGRDPYVFFRERVMVPVMDRRGRVVAFGGRVLPDHLRVPDRSDFTPAKYMNSSETPIFNKSSVLYGAPQARHAATDGHVLFVVEGYFDVIAAHQAGLKGAVAPMGTALTEEQIMLLWKMCPDEIKEPVLCFDGDEAGRRAAERAADRVLPLLGAGKTVRFSFLPEGEDPDSLIASGGRVALAKVLDNAIPMIEFLWRVHVGGRNYDTPEARAALIKSLNDSILRIPDREVQKHYDFLIKQRISDAFFRKSAGDSKGGGYSQGGAVYGRSGQNSERSGGAGGYSAKGRGGAAKKTGAVPVALRSPKAQSVDIKGRVFLAAILNYPAIFGSVEEHLALVSIQNPILERLRQALIFALNEEPELDKTALYTHLKEQGLEEALQIVLSPSTYLHGKFSAPVDAMDDMIVRDKWMAMWQNGEDADLQREIKAGWKSAFHASSEEDEGKVKEIFLGKSSDTV